MKSIVTLALLLVVMVVVLATTISPSLRQEDNTVSNYTPRVLGNGTN